MLVKGGVLKGKGYESGCYVKPAIAEAENHFEIVQHETLCTDLYLLKYSGDVENAIEIQNGVAQGLSSAIMTNNLTRSRKIPFSRRFRLWNCQCKHRKLLVLRIGGAFGGERKQEAVENLVQTLGKCT